MFYEVTELQSAGYRVVLVGDTNLQFGCELLPGNDLACSKQGALFNDKVKERGMKFANGIAGDPATFIKGNLRRALDVVLLEFLLNLLDVLIESIFKL